MMVFPNPMKSKKICAEEKLLAFTECYCPNGHNLVTNNVKFNEFKGILLKISKGEKEGTVALSSVYGCKSRISIGIDLKEGEEYKLSCPECGIEFPTFTKCHCGAKIFSLFLDKEASFDSFVGACSRIGCTNSYIQIGKELVRSVRLEVI